MRVLDITGMRSGRLVAVEATGTRDINGSLLWRCRCDCGRDTIVPATKIKGQRTRSCGCLRSDTASSCHIKHGMRHTRLYRIWLDMRGRCQYKSHKEYNRYGGRGIKVCDEWMHDFLAFYEWAIRAGYDDDLTIDRIDGDGDYSPDNCQWLTGPENARKAWAARREKMQHEQES